MKTTANTCAHCTHTTRPLPADWTTVDFFDRPVIAKEAVFRMSCTVVPDAEKPCLKPATAATAQATTEKLQSTIRGMDGMVQEEPGLGDACKEVKSIPHQNAFDVLRDGHGVILSELGIARITTALQGIHAITAVLQQRELDAEIGNDEGLTFGPTVAVGLIAALATCTEYVSNTIETGSVLGQRAEYGTPAYKQLMDAQFRVRQANRKEAAQ